MMNNMRQKNTHVNNNHTILNICDKYVSNEEYLIHMIPHHQVAIDMSKILIQYTNDPNLAFIARKIIVGQQDQILEMEQILQSKISKIETPNNNREFRQSLIEYYHPKLSKDINTKCHRHFFEMDNKQLKNMKCDTQYIKHMIPHHQVAVNMSEQLLKHSNNMLMISFAYSIILNQKYEIWLLKQLLHQNINYNFMNFN
jgi:uncharacterized protein (DUF305 family)